MHWKTKALIQTVFSHIPGGESLNYLCQRRLFHSLPVADEIFREKADIARRHLENLTRHGLVPVENARFYEFGAGKDLILPLCLYGLGAQEQLLVDIRHLARDELVLDSLRRLESGVVPGLQRRPRSAATVGGIAAALAALGITYRAPCDARETGLPEASVDYITSTSTLEHIDEPEIRLILKECRRILTPDGRMSMFVDYQDHYSYADMTISAYNFLQFEAEEWAQWSPSLQFQNRLRHGDYLALFGEAGFEVVDDRPTMGSTADLEVVRGLPLAQGFRSRTIDELAVRDSFVTLRRAAF
jgi:SAM-dependent methyltransferase